MLWIRQKGPGIGCSFAIACLAVWLGTRLPVIGGPVFGIVLGIAVSTIFKKPHALTVGVIFTSKKILQWSIIILGSGLSLRQIWHTGLHSLGVLAVTLCAAFLGAYVLGKGLRTPPKLTALIGVGTAICGGSAIAAVSPILEASEEEVAYSISAIFLFNIAAVLLFPYLGHILGLSDSGFGMWAGTSINDTSSVVAAAYTYSSAAGAYATIVKLTRTTLIIPISFVLTYFVYRKKRKLAGADGGKPGFSDLRRIFPWFIVWFLFASLLNTCGLFGPHLLAYLSWTGKFMITMALSAIGLTADIRKIASAGFRPLLLGLLIWGIVAGSSLLVQFAGKQW